jgi:hypothetical protein
MLDKLTMVVIGSKHFSVISKQTEPHDIIDNERNY